VRKRAFAIAVATALLAAPALAQESTTTTAPTTTTTSPGPVTFGYDPATHTLFYKLRQLVAGALDAASALANCADTAQRASCLALSVTGPQGQVNHGTIMSAFVNSLPEGRGRGCVVRLLAHSSLGKGDQKVTATATTIAPTTTPTTLAAAAPSVDYKALCAATQSSSAKGKGKALGKAKPKPADGD